MKKIEKSLLADVSLEMTPLTEDNEGMLRGGFSGMGVEIAEPLTNEDCNNTNCYNGPCINTGCSNTSCTNKPCSVGTTTTTTTTKKYLLTSCEDILL